MDYLLFDNSKNQMCFKPRGQILLLGILLHGNLRKKSYKKWIFLAAFWRWALLLHMASGYLHLWFSIYGSGAVTFKCKCDTSKTTWDIRTHWDVIVITWDADLAGKPELCTCKGGLFQASSSLSSTPWGPVKNRDKPKWCEHLSGIVNIDNKFSSIESTIGQARYWLQFSQLC